MIINPAATSVVTISTHICIISRLPVVINHKYIATLLRAVINLCHTVSMCYADPLRKPVFYQKVDSYWAI